MDYRSDRESWNQNSDTVSLAQCIALVVEKALNVQFQEYLGQTNPQQNNFFFIQNKDFCHNVFSEDLKLANYWHDLSDKMIEVHFAKLREMEKELLKEFNDHNQKFELIIEAEEDAYDMEADYQTTLEQLIGTTGKKDKSSMISMPTEFHESSGFEKEVLSKRRSRKDRARGNGTSSSGQTQSTGYQDYSQQQLAQLYGGGLDDSLDHDPEALTPYKKMPSIKVNVPKEECKNELFSTNQPDNVLFRFISEIKQAGIQDRSNYQSCLKFIKSLSASKGFEQLMRDNQLEQHTVASQSTKKGKRKQASGPSEHEKPSMPVLSIADIKMRLVWQFNNYLTEECQNSLFADLLTDDATQSKNAEAVQPAVVESKQPPQKNKKKKNKKKKKKQEEADAGNGAEKPAVEVKPALQNQRVQEALREQATRPISPSELRKDQLEFQERAKQVAKMEANLLQTNLRMLQSTFDKKPLSSMDTSELKTEVRKLKFQGDNDVWLKAKEFVECSSPDEEINAMEQRIRDFQFNQLRQDEQLEEMQDRLERVTTCEMMMQKDMKPDDVGLEMIDNILNNRCQKDSSEDEDEDKESRAFSNYVLRDISGEMGYKQYKTQQKIFEEREGLLSNQVHLDKYTDEAIKDLAEIGLDKEEFLGLRQLNCNDEISEYVKQGYAFEKRQQTENHCWFDPSINEQSKPSLKQEDPPATAAEQTAPKKKRKKQKKKKNKASEELPKVKPAVVLSFTPCYDKQEQAILAQFQAEYEEIYLQEESVSSHKPISVKKNNFFLEEEICSTTAVLPFEKEPELKSKKGKTRRAKNKQALQEHSCDEETVRAQEETFVQDITRRLLDSAVDQIAEQQAKERQIKEEKPEEKKVEQEPPKKLNKKAAKKLKQQLAKQAFEQKERERLKAEAAAALAQKEVVDEKRQNSSSSCQSNWEWDTPANNLWTLAPKQDQQRAPTATDLPEKTTYGLEDMEHRKTLLDLDSLFPQNKSVLFTAEAVKPQLVSSPLQRDEKSFDIVTNVEVEPDSVKNPEFEAKSESKMVKKDEPQGNKRKSVQTPQVFSHSKKEQLRSVPQKQFAKPKQSDPKKPEEKVEVKVEQPLVKSAKKDEQKQKQSITQKQSMAKLEKDRASDKAAEKPNQRQEKQSDKTIPEQAKALNPPTQAYNDYNSMFKQVFEKNETSKKEQEKTTKVLVGYERTLKESTQVTKAQIGFGPPSSAPSPQSRQETASKRKRDSKNSGQGRAEKQQEVSPINKSRSFYQQKSQSFVQTSSQSQQFSKSSFQTPSTGFSPFPQSQTHHYNGPTPFHQPQSQIQHRGVQFPLPHTQTQQIDQKNLSFQVTLNIIQNTNNNFYQNAPSEPKEVVQPAPQPQPPHPLPQFQQMNPYYYMNQGQSMPPQQMIYPQYPPFFNQYQQPHFAPPQYPGSQYPYMYYPDQKQAVFEFQNLHQSSEQNQLQPYAYPMQEFDDANMTYHSEERFLSILGLQIVRLQIHIEKLVTQAEVKRNEVFSLLQELSKDTYRANAEKLDLEMFGSMATKLAIDSSDMDVAICGVVDTQKLASDMTIDAKEIIISQMERLHSALDKVACVESNQLISTASVPVIKLLINFEKLPSCAKKPNELSGSIQKLKVDLIFNDILKVRRLESGLHEIETQTQKVAEFVRAQMVVHPFLKPLALVLKKFLSMKNLNSPFQGTVSSYGLVLMIIAVLKDLNNTFKSFELANSKQADLSVFSEGQRVNLAKAFLHFFVVYGEQFNPSYYAINDQLQFVEPSTIKMEGLDPTDMVASTVLQIIDPVDPRNNIGKQVYNFCLVQDQFQVTQQIIHAKFKEYTVKVQQVDSLAQQVQMLEGVRGEEEQKRAFSEQLTYAKAGLDSFTANLLDKIIMVNCTDLKPIENDPEEHKQKMFLQLSKITEFVKIDQKLSFSTQKPQMFNQQQYQQSLLRQQQHLYQQQQFQWQMSMQQQMMRQQTLQSPSLDGHKGFSKEGGK